MSDGKITRNELHDSVNAELNKVGDLLNINTVDKTDIVSAINEVNTNFIADKTDYVKHPGYVITTGNANTYIATLNPAPTSYVEGMGIIIKINVDSAGSSTLNVNSLGAIPLKNPLGYDTTGLKANGIYTFRYNSTTGNFIMQGEGVDATDLITNVNNILNM